MLLAYANTCAYASTVVGSSRTVIIIKTADNTVATKASFNHYWFNSSSAEPAFTTDLNLTYCQFYNHKFG